MWREAIRGSIRSQEGIVLPFLFSATVPLSVTAVARGEISR